MIRNIVYFAAVVQVVIFTSCSGRILKDEVKRCANISVVSYTSNSWYHWGDDDPAMADSVKVMAFDLISLAADQRINHNFKLDEINVKMKKGELVPGKSSSNYGISEIKNVFSKSKIKFDIKLSESEDSKNNNSYTVISSGILTTLAGIVPSEYAVYVNNLNDYAMGMDPYGKSAASGMKLLNIPDISPDILKSAIGKNDSIDTYYMVINAVYIKQGFTVFGTGSAEIKCTLNAFIYNSAGVPVWKTVVDGEGSSFAVAQYFIFSWKSVEDSVLVSTSDAVKKLADQLKIDLNSIALK